MPMYDYKCKKCSHSFEEFYKIKDYKDKTVCTKCKSEANRSYSIKTSEPTFTQKLYADGFWDKSVNKVFYSEKERNTYLKANGYEHTPTKDRMNKWQEKFVYDCRLGRHDPRLRENAN